MEIINHKGKYYLKTKTGYREILASTDSSLWEHDDTVPYPKTKPALPQPSQSFIEKYVEEYNKGNKITEVMVECEQYWKEINGKFPKEPQFRLKINPKDNTITIKKVKDSWSRKEVVNLIKEAWFQSQELEETVDEWIKENL